MTKELISMFRNSSNTFEGQEKGEEVILLLRRHIFTIVIRLVLFGIACLAPIIVGSVYFSFFTKHGYLNLFLFVSALWYLGFWLAIFQSLTIYTLDTVIITDHRVIENDQRGLFNRVVSELHSYRIQDVSVHTTGIIETFLRFGTVTVQTAASEKQFIFRQLPTPEHVKDVIMDIAASGGSGVKPTTNSGQVVHNSDV